MTKKALLIVTLVLLLTMVACSVKAVPKTGKYATGDGMTTVLLKKDGSFSVQVAARSYVPSGVYETKDKLTLTIDDENELVFSFKNNTLIFESGEWLESAIEKGTEFNLTN